MTKKEFERLSVGDIVCDKDDPRFAFVVHANFNGERVTAVRTIEIRDPSKWKLVHKKKEKNK